MADLKALLDAATRKLLAGDAEGALRLLSEVEKRAQRRPGQLDSEVLSGLERFAELARAAGEGIADARAMIMKAAGGARCMNTYDGNGTAQPVTSRREALGRF